ncbi:hypothetical protein [Litoribrevibacter albus]|nr:hypothetical protein [Litoribrevibacter albus]
MKTVLFLDFIPDSLVHKTLCEQDIEVIHFSEIEQEGLVWPNLVKRCSLVLASGMKGLVHDHPQLSDLLQSMVRMGMKVEVMCVDQPLSNIHCAMINGVQYRFGIDFDSAEQVIEVLEQIMNHRSVEQFTA